MIDLAAWQRTEYTGMRPGLERMRRFLKCHGNPERTVAAVHVAGTNGKGSVCAMIAETLRQAGYRTGLYTSPHLIRVNERISLDGRMISDAALSAIAKEIERSARLHRLTFFEFITGIAFIYFAEHKADVMVLETGLGGRFDATNVIEKPLASVITSIALDHRAVLGNTLELIAAEKAGIIKPAVPVICGSRNVIVRKVIAARAADRKAPILMIGRDFNSVDVPAGLHYSGCGVQLDLSPGLDAAYQKDNVSLACTALLEIRPRLPLITPKGVAQGVASTRWPGRFDERTVKFSGKRRTVVMDGAHNPAAAEALVRSWQQRFGERAQATIVFGVLEDKEYTKIIRTLSTISCRVIVMPVRSPRSLDIKTVADIWKRTGCENVRVADNAADAMHEAMKANTRILVTGSLYAVGEALSLLEGKER